jgi:nitrite reductase (NO-forming)
MKKLIVAAVLTAALTPAGLASARTDATAHAAATTKVSVTGKEFSLHLSKTSISKPGTVAFTFRNAGTMAHDFSIGGKTTALIRPHKTANLTVTFHETGRFTYLCTVPGHAQAGMKGVFTVR